MSDETTEMVQISLDDACELAMIIDDYDSFGMDLVTDTRLTDAERADVQRDRDDCAALLLRLLALHPSIKNAYDEHVLEFNAMVTTTRTGPFQITKGEVRQ